MELFNYIWEQYIEFCSPMYNLDISWDKFWFYANIPILLISYYFIIIKLCIVIIKEGLEIDSEDDMFLIIIGLLITLILVLLIAILYTMLILATKGYIIVLLLIALLIVGIIKYKDILDKINSIFSSNKDNSDIENYKQMLKSS